MNINLESLLFLTPFQPTISIGLEKTAASIRVAKACLSKGIITLSELRQEPLQTDLTSDPNPIISTGLDSRETLTRPLSMPLKKEKDIDAALKFQVEPLLPYPIDQALLGWSKLELKEDGTDILFHSVRKDSLQKHLEEWESLEIEPEIVCSEAIALSKFLKFYSPTTEPTFIIHMEPKRTLCALVKEGNLIASHTLLEGFIAENDDETHKQRLLMAITKTIYSLSKEYKGGTIPFGLVCGEGSSKIDLRNHLYTQLKLTPVEFSPKDYSEEELCLYAIPIGLALNALCPKPINFRQEELVYPHPWKHIKIPLALYYGLIVVLSLSFYFFGQSYFYQQENQLKRQYVEILLEMDKSYDAFEKTFLAKNSHAREKHQGQVVPIEDLSRQDLIDRINFLQNELNSSPDSFPLFANIPRVSDVLAWLSTHPKAVGDNKEQKIQIDHLSYVLVKRPIQGKKQEKYQVKVELEFSSPSPTLAREFHDALIAPNEIVDPKGEIKWNSNRGKYRTSFFLKDKTQYPGQ